MKKILSKKENSSSRQKDIKRTTNSVFEQYKKSFKDLARYDREEKSQLIRHLAKEDIETIYLVLFERFKEIGEPIPSFDRVNKEEIENLVVIPQTKHFGEEQYPTIESKAAILFYKINKGHIFPNGNKRISLACLFIFLESNNTRLDITQDEATRKALEIAQSDPREFQKTKKELETWIGKNLKNK